MDDDDKGDVDVDGDDDDEEDDVDDDDDDDDGDDEIIIWGFPSLGFCCLLNMWGVIKDVLNSTARMKLNPFKASFCSS